MAKSIVGGNRDEDSPMSVVGASRVAGEIASNQSLTGGERIAFLVSLLASLNLFLACSTSSRCCRWTAGT